MPATVWSLGSILVDLVVEVPALPERGGDVIAAGSRTHAGGGFNLAAAVARQGVPCRYAGPHGTGAQGDLVRAALAAEGIDLLLAPRDGRDTGVCITLVEPDGERTFVTMPGVEASPDAVELATCRPGAGDLVAISGYDLAYPASGPVLADWTGTLSPGALVAVDPGPLVLDIPPALLARVLARTGLLTMNQREARLIAGGVDGAAAVGDDGRLSGPDLLTAVRRSAALATLPADAVLVVREGAAGCFATGGPLAGQVLEVPAPQVIAVDTTGAGDTHTGVLLAALARGRQLPDALDRANRAAAISVTRPGPATAPIDAEL